MSESDSINKKLKNNKSIHEKFLEFIDEMEINDEKFNNLNQLFEETKIRDNKHELRLFLHMLVKVSNNYHRGPNFFIKIETILQLFKEEIKAIPNQEIFAIFKSNKRILLYLIEEGILIVDNYFVSKIIKEKYITMKYPQYFAPEIKAFVNEELISQNDHKKVEFNEDDESSEEEEVEEDDDKNWVEKIKKELPDNFYEMRKIGENENYLCRLIRENAVEDFIAHLHKANINRNAKITPSIYETNSFLLKNQKRITLIDYAAFFGSIQIINFLKIEGAKLTPLMWLEAIHGKNADLIHLLEENHIDPTVIVFKNHMKEKSYEGCFKESIKCHHNELVNYFLSNYMQDEYENSNETISQSLKYYNFMFLTDKHIDESLFYRFCQYDYYSIVDSLLMSSHIDINSLTIQNLMFINSINNHSILMKFQCNII